MRRFPPTRALLSALAVLSLAFGLARTSYAGDDAEGAEQEAVFSAYDVALAKGAFPEGWTLLGSADGAADETALKAQVTEAAKAAKADEGIDLVTRSATKGDKKAVFVLVDLDAKAASASDALVKALEEQGKTKGFSVRTLGHPTRILVVAGPDDLREAAVAVQTGYAARMLAIKAQSAWESHLGPRIVMFARAARAIEPKNALANLFLGIAAGNQGAQDKDAKLMDKGIAMLQLALAKDASPALTGRELVMACGELGGILLQKGGPSAEARDVLKEAVKGLADVEYQEGNAYLYNLACAHGRLKELDEAFAALTLVLEANAKKPIQGIDWLKDPDFDNLRPDARWAELKKKYETAGGE